jgi:hypothetical protein
MTRQSPAWVFLFEESGYFFRQALEQPPQKTRIADFSRGQVADQGVRTRTRACIERC